MSMGSELPPRPRLSGPGPWSLTEVADATGLRYEAVYRDVRQGRLSVRETPQGRARRYTVGMEDLAHAARSVYRHACPGATAGRSREQV